MLKARGGRWEGWRDTLRSRSARRQEKESWTCLNSEYLSFAAPRVIQTGLTH